MERKFSFLLICYQRGFKLLYLIHGNMRAAKAFCLGCFYKSNTPGIPRSRSNKLSVNKASSPEGELAISEATKLA